MKIKYFILLFICVLPIVLLIVRSNSISEKIDKYKKLPFFDLVDYTGKTFSKSDLKKNKVVLFMFFNTECDICKAEILQLNTRNKEFQNVEIVLISIQPVEIVKKYIDDIHLILDSNVHVLIDDNLELISSMDISTTPVSLIYDANGILTKRFNGFVKIDTLLLLLTKNNYGNHSN